jgi:hypothetical protein
MERIICSQCGGENVKPIDWWEAYEFKAQVPPEPMWVCNSPNCLHLWKRESGPLCGNIAQVIGHEVTRLRDYPVTSSVLINLLSIVRR